MIILEKNLRPPFDPQDAVHLAREQYGLNVVAEELSSELDRNFYLRDASGEEYVLKIANQFTTESVLDLYNQTLHHAGERFAWCQRMMPDTSGRYMPSLTSDSGESYALRLLEYLEGVPLAEFRPHSDALLLDLGHKLGELDSALLELDHPEKRLDYRWNILNLPHVIGEMIEAIPPERHELIAWVSDLFHSEVIPNLEKLRYGFIHNDANDSNVLVKAHDFDDVRISGLLDFGDMVYAPLVAELAVALAYVMMDKADTLTAAVPVVQGYHQAFPLSEPELAVLFPLVTSRLCISVCISAYQQSNEPENSHLSLHEKRAWDLLERMQDIHPRFAHYLFRDACGYPASPHSEAVHDWIRRNRGDFYPILGQRLTPENLRVFDLSMGSTEIGSMSDFQDTESMTRKMFSQLQKGQVGIGRYNEARPIYTGVLFDVPRHERRTIHIGLDLIQSAGTPIYAPFDGVVYSFQDNRGDKDYGPTIILKHQTDEGNEFFTLYGHLSPDSLDHLQSGMLIRKGDPLAKIGMYPQNGNWFPHVHFQIILDMLNRTGEFPGVALADQRVLWLNLCPDPNFALNIPASIYPKPERSRRDIINLRHKLLNPAMSLSYDEPLKIVRGTMHHLYDHEGRDYLDAVNNVPHVGHSNPRIVEAASRQMAVLNTNTRYLHDTILDYTEKLLATLPESLEVCFLVNSGSEANELALRLARTYTNAQDVLVIDHAYHGNTGSLVEISPYKFKGMGGSGKPEHVHVVPMPDGYRGEFRGYSESIGQRYAQSVQEAIDTIHHDKRKLAAFFTESLMGCGGQIVLPDAYLQHAFASIRAAGAVCIADEVQIGFGRVGSHFWGFETQGVIPDIVTMGKSMGNGHPIGAVVTTRAIADAFANGMEYFNTFGGNPVSCAVALEVLNVIQDEHLQQNALETGAYFKSRLQSLMPRFPLIGQVRGLGLFLGVELVRDHETLAPATQEATYIVERMKNNGILISTEGPHHNVLKIKPPIIFRKAHVDQFVDTLAMILSDTVLQNIP